VSSQAGEGTAWYASSLPFAPKSLYFPKSENYLTKTTWRLRPYKESDEGKERDFEANGAVAPNSILSSLNGLCYEEANGGVGKERRGRVEGGGEGLTASS